MSGDAPSASPYAFMKCSAKILVLKALDCSDRGLFYATILVFTLIWIGNGYLRNKIYAVA